LSSIVCGRVSAFSLHCPHSLLTIVTVTRSVYQF
jgi:hypothetical protein